MDKKELMEIIKAVNLIPVFCHTNLDDYKSSLWPKFLVCRPIEGDNIEDSQGRHLKIVRITHKDNYSTNSNAYFYYLDIELWK